MKRALIFIIALSIAACTVGPNYTRPQTETPPAFTPPPTANADAAEDPAKTLAQWWKTFDDAELDHLVDRALQQNLDIQSASARIAQARAQRDVAAGGELPQVDGAGSAQRYKIPEAISDIGSDLVPPDSGISSPIPSYINLYRVGVDASWELDLFGGTRRSIEAAAANTEAAVAARRGAIVSVLGELGRQYAELRSAQARSALATRRSAIEQELLELADNRQQHGLANDIDVAQARGQLQTTQATLPTLEAQIARSRHAIAVLLGQPPASLDAELAEAAPLPPAPPSVPVGLPSQLLLNRPDVQQADRQLAAATAQIGVAEAQRFPSLSLTAATGFASRELDDLLERGSWNWNGGASISAPIFSAGRLAANQRSAEAAAQQQAIAYRRTVLQAFQEVEDALAGYGAEQTRYGSLSGASDSARYALERIREQYRVGLVPYLQVLDADRTVAQADDAVLQSEAQRTELMVRLYKALGGGWQTVSDDAGAATAAAPADAR
jgi:NodT family efflux transporter outer membrane factor (OMF) lipoprotein